MRVADNNIAQSDTNFLSTSCCSVCFLISYAPAFKLFSFIICFKQSLLNRRGFAATVCFAHEMCA